MQHNKTTISIDERRFYDEDFSSYLKDIIRLGELENPSLGITALVIDKGIESLSPKQKFIFTKEIIDHYYVDECSSCPNDIPWCEMLEAVDNGGKCGWCAHRDSKDD